MTAKATSRYRATTNKNRSSEHAIAQITGVHPAVVPFTKDNTLKYVKRNAPPHAAGLDKDLNEV